jgi:hypothetical protein
MRLLQNQNTERLESEIERIKALDLDGLRLQWRNRFAKRAPKGLPKGLLARALIYRVQADALGDLDPGLVRVLENYAARDHDGVGEDATGVNKQFHRRTAASLAVKPGSVLIREWNGRAHRVMALEDGFAWEGRDYRSLSEIARTITGTRWNGRRFFGVDRKREGTRAESEGSADETTPSGKMDGPTGGFDPVEPPAVAAKLDDRNESPRRESNSS